MIRSIADLRAEPRADSELVDQVRHGERLTLLAEVPDWMAVQAREDHYFGWIERELVGDTDDVPEQSVVAVNLAITRAEPREDSDATGVLAAGTWLALSERRAGFAFIPWGFGWIRESDLASRENLPRRAPTPGDVLAAARAFRDAPYLWGGTTARGLDCSGFVQLAYRLCGIVLTRDADQQATQGRAVEGPPRAADLLFFGTPVDHVGMALDETRMIHAAGGAIGRVVEQPIAERGTPVSTRRYLP